MYKNILANAQNVEWFGIFSLVLFFVFFLGLIIYVFAMKKVDVDILKNLPLNDQEPSKNNLP